MTLDNFLQKPSSTGSIERTAESGRPKSSRTGDSISVDEELIRAKKIQIKKHIFQPDKSRERYEYSTNDGQANFP